jgi:hypothetical protein
VIVRPFLDAWIVKAVISHHSCATTIGEETTSIGTTVFGPVVRWHPDEAAPIGGVGGSEAASSKARAVLC